jgi:hypothetical protein
MNSILWKGKMRVENQTKVRVLSLRRLEYMPGNLDQMCGSRIPSQNRNLNYVYHLKKITDKAGSANRPLNTSAGEF